MTAKSRCGFLVLGVVFAARAAGAHIEPIDPSSCTFDPIVVDAPALALRAAAVPARAIDALEITYDTGASAATFEAGSVPARAFGGSGIAGTLAFPAAFEMQMQASGDLAAESIPLAFTVDGVAANVRTTLTTGLAAAGDVIVEGAPLTGRGWFTLVGVVGSGTLPPPLGGAPTIIRLTCQATPAPDLDQFADPTLSRALSGIITRRAVHLRAVLEPGRSQSPDFAGTPAIVRLTGAETTIASVHLPTGLAPRGRRAFVGRSADPPATVVVRRAHRGMYVLALRVRGATMPSEAGAITVQMTYQVGGLLSRVSRLLRATGGGRAFMCCEP